jgi:hypothetical protein
LEGHDLPRLFVRLSGRNEWQDLLRHMDAAHPDELLGRVLAVDKKMRKYRRFFTILKDRLLQGSDRHSLSGGAC